MSDSSDFITTPTLKTLKSRECSLEELQTALIQVIEDINRLSYNISQKEDRKWRATI
jgi:hypothetical protein